MLKRLSQENKKKLTNLSASLNPKHTHQIEITAFTDNRDSQNQTTIANKRLKKISKYLIKRKGISADRINTQIEATGFSNNIEITTN
ncbi:MAG: OmpA family protein [Ferruginibacter sp.]|nr:OmpA family protein [Ferruginibacter sp.]